MTKASHPGASASVPRAFNPYIHGARGLFAFMIVVFHVVNSRLPTVTALAHGWPLFLIRSTEYGVELFFGISGIVIVGALARARNPLIFAVERGTRIYPVLWASLGFIVILSAFTGFEGRTMPSLSVLIMNLLALPPLLPGPLIYPAAWSLNYELAFYGFCALAWALRRRLGRSALALVVPLAILAVGWRIRVILMPVGMAVAVLFRQHPNWSRFARAPGLCLIIFVLLWETISRSVGGDLSQVSVLQLQPLTLTLSFIAAVVAGLAFTGIMSGNGFFNRVLASRPLQFLGTISYSLYLWHLIVMAVVKVVMRSTGLVKYAGPASQLLFFALSFPPSILIAWLSEQVLEKRVTVRLRRAIEHNLAGKVQELPPTTVVHPPIERRPEINGS